MLVQDIISLAMRTSGVLGVGQTPLAQDLTDCQNLLTLIMQQWRQKRWLVFRLDNVTFPITLWQPSYSVGPSNATTPPDVVVTGNYRPANIQSCYLRQLVGSGPNSFPVDFPMRILRSRQEFDAIRLKSLGSWPSLVYYDPTIPAGQLYIWPIPIQQIFELYIGFQQAIDMAAEGTQTVELTTLLPAETQLALMYQLALQVCIAWKLPPDQELAAAARASVNTLRMTNFALQPLAMPTALRWRGARIRNPAAGFYYETSVGIPTTVLS